MNKCLLIVDDDASVISVLKYAFDNKGYDIITAEDGEAAYKVIKEEKPDVIILDVLMPKKDGFTLLKELRSESELKDTPIIIASAVYRNYSIIQKTIKELGATDYFTKPFDLKRLVERVLQLCPVEREQEEEEEPVLNKKVSRYLFSDNVPDSYEFKIIPACKVIAGFFMKKRTGVLLVSSKSIVKKIALLEGVPLQASSNIASEWLGRMLVRDNVITHEQYKETLGIMTRSNKKHGAVLIDNNLLTPHDLYKYLQKQLYEKIVNTFTWTNGAYTFTTKIKIKDTTQKHINPLVLVYNGIKNKVGIDFIKAELDEIKPDSVFEIKNINALLEATVFSGRELRFIRSFNGNTKLSDIIEQSKLGDDAYSLLYTLLLVNSFDLVDPYSHSIKEMSKASRYTVKKSEHLSPYDLKIIKRITKLYDNLSKLSYYELLGIKRDADSSDIKKSYFKLAKEFHPDKFSEGKFEEVRERASKIFAEVAKAYQTISNDGLRKEYDESFFDKEKNTQLQKANEIVAAEMQFQKGSVYLNSKDYVKALDAFTWSIKLNPDEAEYHLYYAITIFKDPKIDPVEARVEAKEILERVISMNPNLDLAHYYLASIHKLEKKPDLAKKHFHKAYTLNPKNYEAERELRLMSMRKEKEQKGFFKSLFK